MKKLVYSIGLVLLVTIWWSAAAPREEIGCCISESVVFDPVTVERTQAVDRSKEFAAAIATLEINLPAYDDAVFLDDGESALVTAHDGQIWMVDLAAHTAEPFADVPLMAWGIQIHQAPGNPPQVYFCAAGSYAARSPGEVPGLYRLDLNTRSAEPLALRVPDTQINHQRPVVYADEDPNAPELQADDRSTPSRKIMVCDNLEVSADGRRIYFSEPFNYENASTRDAVHEAIALARNGRLWRHDLDTGSTRLIAEGFHFINGVLYDPHPGKLREESVLVSQTSLFRVMRFYVNGPKAGTSEIVIDGLPGMPDGMDRDAAGRIWLAMFADRGPLLTWAHEHAWIKPLLMRLPTAWLLSQARRTGVVVLSPDGSRPLYSAFYKGPELASIASAVPAPSGIFLANIALSDADPEQKKPIQRLGWPSEWQYSQ
ncbi:SMP-30/gluconolactonase/LRE family protein [Nitrosomonas halophila]|uniref:SMP-30/Gluconolaconase/LRE-like region-containing protein n=1 Tax=Nitrosomonas halophila TaxID=44576 RepID=A0A1H3EW76_9PROT|nr:SMP-30/gluconolactonase/LRE family protein [Nitrosomonas halophila]SDX82174.1 SMP-30/Gluconolaconase/LRE-like region-containing protein [Nitrosomonas halophila]